MISDCHDKFGAPIGIEEVGPDQWQRVREIRLATLKDAPYAFGSTYEGELPQPEAWWRQRLTDGRWFIAVEGGQDLSVGMLMWAPLPDSFESNATLPLIPDGDVPWIRAVWTQPRARGRHLVDAVCLRICEVAAEQGAAMTVLGVRSANDRARAAYRRMGFTDIGTFIPSSAPVESPNWLMARTSIITG